MKNREKIVIVGGVAGGASTATRLRRLDEEAEIIMFEKGPYTSFANCGLPYYIGGVIQNRANLIVQTPEKIKGRFEVDVRVNSEVISVDIANKTLKIRTSEGKEYIETYDKLVLSPGAKALVPSLPGIENNKIFTLRNIPDTDKIKNYIDKNKVKNAIVIGGGYVGIEMVENLKDLGIEVTLVEAAPHILANFDNEISTFLEKEISSHGVQISLGKKAVKFQDKNNKVEVTFDSGEQIETDMVILSIGITPDTEFLKESGIELGNRGHILVNERMQTNIENIYALGDAVSIPLAGPANRQGRIVANNLCGRIDNYIGTIGTSIIKVFDLTAAGTGSTERDLIKRGEKFEKIYLHPGTHASYYPGATLMTLKVLFSLDSKMILGAQAVGYEGIDKFIDVIATTIKFKGTVEDLAELELAYAPPYSSAKSPANMAGFIGENIVEGLVRQIHFEELKEFDSEKHFILDVREPIELVGGKLEHSVNIPLNEIRKNLNEIPKEKEIWTYCAVGLRGYIAARILMQYGYRVRNLSGGIKLQGGYTPIENNEIISGCSVVKEYSETGNSDEMDLTGLSCPGPLIQVKSKMDSLKNGDILKVKASDPGFLKDIEAWAKTTNNQLLNTSKEKGIVQATLKKGNENQSNENQVIETKDGMTIVVFSGDLDKAIAAFIIANGAATMGKKVTMFFTFWGLSIIKKQKKIKTQKNFIEKMFEAILPKNSLELGLSKMNMLGMGRVMIRWIMKDKGIMSLEQLIQQAKENGIDLVACNMSMDVMGIHREELLDNVNLGGVGYYLGEANNSNQNLFI